MPTSLSARTVYLKLHPTARSFSERREVLRVIERFGEVTMFKSYKYSPRSQTPNTFLALFASESSAKDLINASPIRYTLISNPSSLSSAPPSESTSDPATTLSSSIPPRYPQESPSSFSPSSTPDTRDNTPTLNQQQENQSLESASENPETSEPTPHPYQLHAYPSILDHNIYLSSSLHSPFHGPWKPTHPSYSYISSSLSQIIPPSIYSAGLMDWEIKRDPKEGEAGKNGETGGAGFWFKGREMRRAEKGRPRVMAGLGALRRDWEAKEAEKQRE